MFSIEGKVVFLTGALGGMGKCFVRELLKNGAKGIALLDINDTCLESFQKEIEEQFGANKTFFIKIDLTDPAQIDDAYEKTVDHFKQLDIVINNAGIAEGDFLKCLQTNFVATAYSTHLAFRKYLGSYRIGEEGIVINIASVAGLSPFPIVPGYSPSKNGVITLGRCFGHKIHYNARKTKIMTICPGLTDTPIVEQKSELHDDVIDLLDLSNSHMQRPENVATALIDIIKNGNNGSTWVVKNDKPAEEVDFTKIDEVIAKFTDVMRLVKDYDI